MILFQKKSRYFEGLAPCAGSSSLATMNWIAMHMVFRVQMILGSGPTSWLSLETKRWTVGSSKHLNYEPTCSCHLMSMFQERLHRINESTANCCHQLSTANFVWKAQIDSAKLTRPSSQYLLRSFEKNCCCNLLESLDKNQHQLQHVEGRHIPNLHDWVADHIANGHKEDKNHLPTVVMSYHSRYLLRLTPRSLPICKLH